MAALTNKQEGITTILAANTSATATVSSYTASRSILIIQPIAGNNAPHQYCTKGYKSSSTQLTFERDATGGNDVVVRWVLLEFDADVSVQDVNYTSTGSQTISSVTTGQTWIVYGGYSPVDDFNLRDGGDISVTTSTSVTVRQTQTPVDIRAQIIDYTGCSVQQVIRTGDSGTPVNVTISSVTTSQSVPLSVGGDYTTIIDSEDIYRIAFTTSTNVQANAAAGGPVDWTLHVVEFSDGSTTQEATAQIVDLTVDVTISSVTTSNSCCFSSGVGGEPYSFSELNTKDDDHQEFAAHQTFVSATSVRSTRATNPPKDTFSAVKVIEWNTQTFDPATLPPPVYPYFGRAVELVPAGAT